MKKNLPAKLITEIISALLFPVFLITFISLLCFWDLILKLSPQSILDKIVRYFNYTIYSSLKLICTSYKVEGKVPEVWSGPCIIISNHQSMFDMPWLYSVFNKFNPRYVAKIELSKNIPGISICLKKGGSALIDRKNSNQAINEIQSLAKRMRKHQYSAIIFPEGTRARDGELKKFKMAGLKELVKNLGETKLIPVAIDNSWILMTRKYGPIPGFCRLKMRIGEPIEVNQGSDVEMAIKESFDVVKGLLEEIRLEG